MMCDSIYNDILPIIFKYINFDILNFRMVNKHIHSRAREYAYSRDCPLWQAKLVVKYDDIYLTRIYNSDIAVNGSAYEVYQYVQKDQNLLLWLLNNNLVPDINNTFVLSKAIVMANLPVTATSPNVIIRIKKADLLDCPELADCAVAGLSLIKIISREPELLMILPFSHNLAKICKSYLQTAKNSMMAHYAMGFNALKYYPYNPQYLSPNMFMAGPVWNRFMDALSYSEKAAIAIAYVLSPQYIFNSKYPKWDNYINVLKCLAGKTTLKSGHANVIFKIYTDNGGFSDIEIAEFSKKNSVYNWPWKWDIDAYSSAFIKRHIRDALHVV